MLADRAGRVVVTSLGWLDRGSLVVLDTATSREVRHVVSEDATHLELVPGERDHFAVVALSDQGFEVTARHLEAPTRMISRLHVDGHGAVVEGDADVWGALPPYYLGRTQGPARATNDGYMLVRVDPVAHQCLAQTMNWFSRDAFDPIYQSLGVPTALNLDRVAIPVQRSSRLVVFDWAARHVAGGVELAGRGGNPQVGLRTADELWVSDYDTLIVLDAQNPSLRRHEARLQEPVNGARHPVGDWSFTPDRSRCVVPRPASGDVVVLDCDTFQITDRVKLGREPLEAALLDDGRIFARDWKTGDWLVGSVGS